MENENNESFQTFQKKIKATQLLTCEGIGNTTDGQTIRLCHDMYLFIG